MSDVTFNRDRCLVTATMTGDLHSIGTLRRHWRQICIAIHRDQTCHVLVKAGVVSHVPYAINQEANITKALSECLRDIKAYAAIAIHPGRLHHIAFGNAVLVTQGINAGTFETEEEALAWLKTQPHHPDCPYA